MSKLKRSKWLLICVALISMLSICVCIFYPSVIRSKSIYNLRQQFQFEVMYCNAEISSADLQGPVKFPGFVVAAGWLRSALGNRPLPVVATGDKVVTIALQASIHAPPSPATIQQLAAFPEVERLIIQGFTIPDGINFYGKLKMVRWFSAINCNMSDAEASLLLAQSPIEIFQCFDSSLTMNFSEDFQPFGHVRAMMLSGTNISDESVKTLNRFSRIRELDLSNTTISPQGIQVIYLPELTEIHLQGLKIDRTAIESLGQFSIKTLDLADTGCYDNDIEPVLSWIKLDNLFLDNTNISSVCICRVLKNCPLKSLVASTVKCESADLVDALLNSQAKQITVTADNLETFQEASTELQSHGWKFSVYEGHVIKLSRE